MKKLISILLCISVMMGGFCFTNASAGSLAGEDRLKVGSLTPMSGHFFTDMWGNNTADMDVRALIHGYSTVAFNGEGHYVLDETVIADTRITQDDLGNITYRFTLNQNLTYNDGTPITAKDYLFSAMLLSDPRMTRLGAVPGALEHLLGYDEYVEDVLAYEAAAQNNPPQEPITGVRFQGLHLISEYEFSITIDAEYLPYFYELSLAMITPYPIGTIAPGCEIADDGSGARIDGPLTSELLQQTVLNPETGYLYHPAVTSGPYALVSYDAVSHEAMLDKNPAYRGNYEGQLPQIEKLFFRSVDERTMLQQLADGQLDLINKVSSGAKINEALALLEEADIAMGSYPRSGLSFVSFACEDGYTASADVRKAIAMCVDAEALCSDYLMGYGIPVYGYYGVGQWMVQGVFAELLELARYSLNLNAARGLLEQDGWTLNELGEPYDEEIGGVRYRQREDGALEPLTIRWARPQGVESAEALSLMLRENMEAVGFALEETALPFSELLQNYYRQVEREYDMLYMATNFALIFDPYYAFNTRDEYQGVFNTTGIRDEALMELAEAMRETEPDDAEGYLAKWMAFQHRFGEVLPMAPLYSNIYFDIYRSDLQQYDSNSDWSWGNAILYAYVGEPPVETEIESEVDSIEEGDWVK